MKLEQLENIAHKLDFDACGIAPVNELTEQKKYLEAWLSKKHHAGLYYMENNKEMRANPALLVEGALSVIVTLTNYYHPKLHSQDTPQISIYAYGEDYHKVLKRKHKQLLTEIENLTGKKITGRIFVDSAPVFEKEWARRAGLGWIGKNNLLINPHSGSFCFIGVIISDFITDEYSKPFENNFCGKCTRCIDSCPTGALKPYDLNANLCISYNNKEKSVQNPQIVKEKLNLRIYGCDTCQDVCPWNTKAVLNKISEFKPSEWISKAKKEDWLNLNEITFQQIFSKSPIKSTGFDKIRQNIIDCELPQEHI